MELFVDSRFKVIFNIINETYYLNFLKIFRRLYEMFFLTKIIFFDRILVKSSDIIVSCSVLDQKIEIVIGVRSKFFNKVLILKFK